MTDWLSEFGCYRTGESLYVDPDDVAAIWPVDAGAAITLHSGTTLIVHGTSKAVYAALGQVRAQAMAAAAEALAVSVN